MTKSLSKICTNVSLMMSGVAMYCLLAYGGYVELGEPLTFLGQALKYFFFACILAFLSGFFGFQTGWERKRGS